MGRIRDLVQYAGALARGDIWFMLDGNTFAKGLKMSGQQVYDLCKGADGRQLEIRNNGTQLQWRYQGDASWNNLVVLSTLRGEDGKELEVRVSGGHIQWRLTGGTWANLTALTELKGDKGEDAALPVFGFAITALASNATPTASVSGTYPNLTVNLGIPKGVDAALPVFGFEITALASNATPTAAVTGTYPNLTVALGLPKGKDADAPAFTFSAEGTASGSSPDVEMTGTYPNLNLHFKIPAGLQGVEGRGPVVLANGNYGNWDAGLQQFVDSGVPAVAAVSEAAVTFTQAEVRANITSGESLKVLMGKIRKWFADMGTLAFKNKADWNTDIENPPTIPSKLSDLTNDTGFYEKPLTGIPGSDMDTAVQASLDRADTALQWFTESDPVYTAEKSKLALKSDIEDIVEWAKSQQLVGQVVDVRTLKKNGVYKLNPGSTNTPSPADGWFVLVMNDGLRCKQLLSWDSGSSVWEQTLNIATGVWSPFKRLLNSDDFTNTDRAKLDFVGSQTLSGLASMAITKQIVHVAASGTQAFSMSSVVVNDMAFVVVFTATGAATVIIPSASPYVSMAEATYTLAAGDVIEIHGFKSSTDGFYHLAVLEKS